VRSSKSPIPRSTATTKDLPSKFRQSEDVSKPLLESEIISENPKKKVVKKIVKKVVKKKKPEGEL